MIPLVGSVNPAIATIGACRRDSSQAIVVRQGAIPPWPSYAITGSSRLCPGETVTLTSNAQNVTFQWSNNATTNAITVSNPGIYFVQVRNADGCSNVSDQIIVRRIPATPTPTISPASGAEICFGDSIILQAQPGNAQTLRYRWSTNDSTQTLVVRTPCNYTVQATDTGGCMSEASVPVVVSPGIAPVVDSLIFNANRDSLTAYAPGAVAYIWTFAGNPIANQTATVEFLGSGLYSVQAVGASNCILEVFNQLITNNLIGKTSQTLRTWPNPAKGILHVEGLKPADGITQAIMVHPSGKQQHLSLTTQQGQALLDVYELPAGLYVLRVLNQGKWEQVKFGVE